MMALRGHVILRRGNFTWYYYDEITWIVGGLALLWLGWFVIRRYRRARAMQRQPRRQDHKVLKQIVKAKSELSSQWLRPGFSNNIHAVGIGKVAGVSAYCIQVFVSDSNAELWTGSGALTLPPTYRGVPLVLIEMLRASFLTQLASPVEHSLDNGIRDRQEVLFGGISGAHTNLSGASGTIGYFCTRRSRLRRRQEVHLLSNSHVFADLRKGNVDDGDLIMQPSPGEAGSNRAIGTLVNFSKLNFDDVKQPNHVDAAIARLWDKQKHNPIIPLIGAINGHVRKEDIQLGEAVRKFGRTTGYTEGDVFSIYLDIWVRYDRTGQSAFFQDQFLLQPRMPRYQKFVSPGDSGSLVVDTNQYAIGLIFAGVSELPDTVSEHSVVNANAGETVSRVEGYGVANPISVVLDRLKVDLV